MSLATACEVAPMPMEKAEDQRERRYQKKIIRILLSLPATIGA